MFTIDRESEFGQRVLRRLEREEIIWLTTCRPEGTPQPSPVWFHWDGEALLIYSQPDTPKLRNIAANPRVALNFNATPTGGDVVVLTGTAAVPADRQPATSVPAYIEKYRSGLAGLGMAPEAFAADYSVPVRVTPTHLRGF
jgi:PPOX class probable F420-dependent enzyme